MQILALDPATLQLVNNHDPRNTPSTGSSSDAAPSHLALPHGPLTTARVAPLALADTRPRRTLHRSRRAHFALATGAAAATDSSQASAPYAIDPCICNMCRRRLQVSSWYRGQLTDPPRCVEYGEEEERPTGDWSPSGSPSTTAASTGPLASIGTGIAVFHAEMTYASTTPLDLRWLIGVHTPSVLRASSSIRTARRVGREAGTTPT